MHPIEVPTLETRKCFFDVELMELVARARFEGEGMDFDKTVHEYPHYK